MTRNEERTQKEVLAALTGGIALPSGGATEAKQDTGNASLSSIDSKFISDSGSASGTIATGNLEVIMDVSGYGSVIAQLKSTGTNQSSPLDFAVTAAATIDGVTWGGISGCDLRLLDGQIPLSFSSDGFYSFNVSGFRKFKLYVPLDPGPGVSVFVFLRAQKAISVLNQIQAITFVDTSAANALLGSIASLLASPGIKIAGPAAETSTQVASSATNVTLLSANSSRLSGSIFNSSTQILYVKHGVTASTSSYKVQIAAGGYYELPYPAYTGQIDGIWASANGNAYVTEGV